VRVDKASLDTLAAKVKDSARFLLKADAAVLAAAFAVTTAFQLGATKTLFLASYLGPLFMWMTGLVGLCLALEGWTTDLLGVSDRAKNQKTARQLRFTYAAVLVSHIASLAFVVGFGTGQLAVYFPGPIDQLRKP
jgi:hypothetical protein